jgi:hypothetical protein
MVYVVRDANGQALEYICSRDNEAEAKAKVLNKDEACRVAINAARLPELPPIGFSQLSPDSAATHSQFGTNASYSTLLHLMSGTGAAGSSSERAAGLDPGGLWHFVGELARKSPAQAKAANKGGYTYRCAAPDLLADELA